MRSERQPASAVPCSLGLPRSCGWPWKDKCLLSVGASHGWANWSLQANGRQGLEGNGRHGWWQPPKHNFEQSHLWSSQALSVWTSCCRRGLSQGLQPSWAGEISSCADRGPLPPSWWFCRCFLPPPDPIECWDHLVLHWCRREGQRIGMASRDFARRVGGESEAGRLSNSWCSAISERSQPRPPGCTSRNSNYQSSCCERWRWRSKSGAAKALDAEVAFWWRFRRWIFQVAWRIFGKVFSEWKCRQFFTQQQETEQWRAKPRGWTEPKKVSSGGSACRMLASLWQNCRDASIWDEAWRKRYHWIPDPHQPPALFGQPDLPWAQSQSNVAFGWIWQGIVQAVQGRWHTTWESFAFSDCFLRCLGLPQRRCADDFRSAILPKKNQASGYCLLPQGYTFWAKNWWPDIVWLQVDPQNLLCAADETRRSRWRSRKTRQRRDYILHQHRLTRNSWYFLWFAMCKSDLACVLDSQGAAAAEAHDPFNQKALPCCRSVLQTQ